jgi:hypothetical protein
MSSSTHGDELALALDPLHEARVQLLTNPRLVHTIRGQDYHHRVRILQALLEDLVHETVAGQDLPLVVPHATPRLVEALSESACRAIVVFPRVAEGDPGTSGHRYPLPRPAVGDPFRGGLSQGYPSGGVVSVRYRRRLGDGTETSPPAFHLSELVGGQNPFPDEVFAFPALNPESP